MRPFNPTRPHPCRNPICRSARGRLRQSGFRAKCCSAARSPWLPLSPQRFYLASAHSPIDLGARPMRKLQRAVRRKRSKARPPIMRAPIWVGNWQRITAMIPLKMTRLRPRLIQCGQGRRLSRRQSHHPPRLNPIPRRLRAPRPFSSAPQAVRADATTATACLRGWRPAIAL